MLGILQTRNKKQYLKKLMVCPRSTETFFFQICPPKTKHKYFQNHRDKTEGRRGMQLTVMDNKSELS